jgi:hypothetical protein
VRAVDTDPATMAWCAVMSIGLLDESVTTVDVAVPCRGTTPVSGVNAMGLNHIPQRATPM